MECLKSATQKIKSEIMGDNGPITGIIVGAGNRGKVYSKYSAVHPKELKIVGVAEPRKTARIYMKNTYKIDEKCCFDDWKALCAVEKFADCAIICTQDQDHVGPAVELANKGYHILLEKPMAVTPDDCKLIYQTCRDKNVKLAVCHVLRYHPCVKKLKELIDSGLIGEVVNISHTEPVGYWHFAHSFVRGNWHNQSKSTFSLLAKCCHDVDLIAYWMSGHKCIRISSFGSLLHFKASNKPKNAGDRCLDCKVEPTCPYSAKKIYLDHHPFEPQFPMSVVCDIENIENSEEGYMHHLRKALETSPYGQCVYSCDNDVCDNQVVNFQFDNGATANLTMVAFSKDICDRKTTIYGTKGELKWDNSKGRYLVYHFDFLSDTSDVIFCEEENPGWGHGGSDYFIMKSFVNSLASKNENLISTGPLVSLRSHLLTFAAENSRLTGKVLNLEEDQEFLDS